MGGGLHPQEFKGTLILLEVDTGKDSVYKVNLTTSR